MCECVKENKDDDAMVAMIDEKYINIRHECECLLGSQ